jgi:hypothetical protein
MVDEFALEVIPLIFVLGTVDFLFDQFSFDVEEGSILDGQVLVLLHHFPHLILQVLIYFIQIVELFQQDQILFVLFLQLLMQFHKEKLSVR